MKSVMFTRLFARSKADEQKKSPPSQDALKGAFSFQRQKYCNGKKCRLKIPSRRVIIHATNYKSVSHNPKDLSHEPKDLSYEILIFPKDLSHEPKDLSHETGFLPISKRTIEL